MAKDSQTRFVSNKKWERIEQWSRRKPVFALMGEFSAGKSTLMNFLLRSHALPTQVTATQLPPVWFSWGKQSAYVQGHDGSRENIGLDQLESVGVNDAQFVRIFLESDILEAVDLIDTPGISDPKISDDVWRRAVGQANGVLWCTHATQAWRETERATWVSLPERLQNNSLLLVTRADVLGTKDRQKVLRRVNREAGHLFNRSILFSARDAIVARDKSGDAELWARSGGGKMVDSFLEITEQIMDNRAEILSRYQIDSGLRASTRVQPLRPEKSASGSSHSRPLKLVDPVLAEDPSAANDEVVTNFPVRPARVEARSGETERASRIDAGEADRLRAEMGAAPLADTPEQEDDLRAFFKESPSQNLNLTELHSSSIETDQVDPMSDEELGDDAGIELTSTAELDQPGDAASEPDAFVESLEGKLANLPEQAEVEEELADSQPADVSVSSIAALMAEQASDTDDEFEPELESNDLHDMQVVPLTNVEALNGPEQNERLEDLLNVPAGTLISAAAMWREITQDEELPQDADGLKTMFQSFLQEFDQIAAEHNARSSKGTMPTIPKPDKNNGPEWHVL